MNFIYTRNHHEHNICFFLNILDQCSLWAQIYKDLEADNFISADNLLIFKTQLLLEILDFCSNFAYWQQNI